jgi:hypothetical protein
LPLRSRLSFLTAFFLGFEERPFYSLNVPNDPREEGAFLEVWCDLMKAELKIAREEIAELRREGANKRHWLYAESSLEECSASLEIISRLIQKRNISQVKSVPNLAFDRDSKSLSKLERVTHDSPPRMDAPSTEGSIWLRLIRHPEWKPGSGTS